MSILAQQLRQRCATTTSTSHCAMDPLASLDYTSYIPPAVARRSEAVGSAAATTGPSTYQSTQSSRGKSTRKGKNVTPPQNPDVIPPTLKEILTPNSKCATDSSRPFLNVKFKGRLWHVFIFHFKRSKNHQLIPKHSIYMHFYILPDEGPHETSTPKKVPGKKANLRTFCALSITKWDYIHAYVTKKTNKQK